MSATIWIITKDHTENGATAQICSKNYNDKSSSLATHQFRMLDGDRRLNYEGLCSDKNSEDAFAPLDDFGTPAAGCASIWYLEEQGWSEL